MHVFVLSLVTPRIIIQSKLKWLFEKHKKKYNKNEGDGDCCASTNETGIVLQRVCEPMGPVDLSLQNRRVRGLGFLDLYDGGGETLGGQGTGDLLPFVLILFHVVEDDNTLGTVDDLKVAAKDGLDFHRFEQAQQRYLD